MEQRHWQIFQICLRIEFQYAESENMPDSESLSPLTVEKLKKEARVFAIAESAHAEPSLFGVTDGKAVGTYLEHKFQTELLNRYAYPRGSSAKGIDFRAWTWTSK